MSRNFFILLFATTSFHTFCNAQKHVNFVVQINEKIIISGLSNMHIVFDSIENSEKFDANYVPGDLTISEDVWGKINSDTTSTFFLKFNYSFFAKNKQRTSNFYVELKKFHLEQRYLILNVYDFSDRKYKRWYQWQTNKNFLGELSFPGSGIYIRSTQ